MKRTILRAEEVADYMGVSMDTLKYWRARNEGPRFFKIGRRVAYDLAAVDEWLDDLRATTAGGAPAA